jgi:hypothetical protein
MFEDDIRLRRAGTEALVNLLYCEDVFNMVCAGAGPPGSMQAPCAR